jgi:trans-aconitate methyltransferase
MALVGIRERSTESEQMDTDAVGFEDFRACLVDLARVNRWTFAYRPTLRFLDRWAATARPERPLEIVDVGSGYGDMLRAIDDWAARRGVAVSLTGVDRHPWARRAALEATPPGRTLRWITADAFGYTPERPVDLVVSSLFTHHLSDSLVVEFLRWMERTARLGWFVNDLRRASLPFHGFRAIAKVARVHRFVQHDGPVSIARAFAPSDWRRLVREAGLDERDVAIRRTAPFRLTVERRPRS